MTSRFAIAKDRVIDALDDIVPELFGSGRQQTARYRARWAVCNRWRGGAKIDQMSVWREAGRRGAWKDFVSGEAGDAIDLVAYGLTGAVTQETRMKALEWIEDRFGIRTMSPEAQREIEQKARARREAMQKAEAERNQSDRERARKFFYSCAPEILGTDVERYLMGRGIRLEAVPNLTPALRHCAEAEYWEGAQRDGEGRKIGQVPRFPAMVAMMISPSAGKIGACHYTFLEPGGARKLDTAGRGFTRQDGAPKSAKLMWPSSAGLLIPLTYGPSGLKASAAAEAGNPGWWAITEGIEDGLSLAMSDDRLRVFAAGSLSGLLGIPDHPSVRGYLVAKDNDWGKPQAQALFDRALVRLRSFGKPVEELAMPPDWGKDVNDALRKG